MAFPILSRSDQKEESVDIASQRYYWPVRSDQGENVVYGLWLCLAAELLIRTSNGEHSKERSARLGR